MSWPPPSGAMRKSSSPTIFYKAPNGAFFVCSNRFPTWISWAHTGGSEGAGPMFPVSWRAVRRVGRDLAFFLPFSCIAGISREMALSAQDLSIVVVLCHEAVS